MTSLLPVKGVMTTEIPPASSEPPNIDCPLRWKLVYEGLDEASEPLRESLTSIGNGNFVTRGAAEDAPLPHCSQWKNGMIKHYPGTYLGGGYNRAESVVEDHTIVNEDLVNWPNWLPITFKLPEWGDNWFSPSSSYFRLLQYTRRLDLKRGILVRSLKFVDPQNRETIIRSRRYVHMGGTHLASIQYKIEPGKGWLPEADSDGIKMTIRSSIDASVRNLGVERYRQLTSKHIEILNIGGKERTQDGESIEEGYIWALVQSNSSHLEVCEAARTRIFKNHIRIDLDCSERIEVEDVPFSDGSGVGKMVHHYLDVPITDASSELQEIMIQKVIALCTSRDAGIYETLYDTQKVIQHAPSFQELRHTHTAAWDDLWARCDVVLKPSAALKTHHYKTHSASTHPWSEDEHAAASRTLDEVFVPPSADSLLARPRARSRNVAFDLDERGEMEKLNKEQKEQGEEEEGEEGEEESESESRPSSAAFSSEQQLADGSATAERDKRKKRPLTSIEIRNILRGMKEYIKKGSSRPGTPATAPSSEQQQQQRKRFMESLEEMAEDEDEDDLGTDTPTSTATTPSPETRSRKEAMFKEDEERRRVDSMQGSLTCCGEDRDRLNESPERAKMQANKTVAPQWPTLEQIFDLIDKTKKEKEMAEEAEERRRLEPLVPHYHNRNRTACPPDSLCYEQMIVRLHIYHLLSTVSYNSMHRDISIPARGLTGEAYRGKIFWDTLFVAPFYMFRLPEVSRVLMNYRYNRLNQAKENAKKAGLKGALFPWQSGSNGEEATQVLHKNPLDGKWYKDPTSLQRHVNLVIAYNLLRYFDVTGDLTAMELWCAEVLLEIARLWASIAKLDPSTADQDPTGKKQPRFVIEGVLGPNEFHEREGGPDSIYSDLRRPRLKEGLRNNAYTNVMVVFVLARALGLLRHGVLREQFRRRLVEKMNITVQELEKWHQISTRMLIPFCKDDPDVLLQHEAWEGLKELDWDHYRKKYGGEAGIARMDRILRAENLVPDDFKLTKQPDASMIFYLLTPSEFKSCLGRCGYQYHDRIPSATVDYYEKRCSHGSTLSKVAHAAILFRLPEVPGSRERAWRYFRDALRSDIEDIQGGTTSEGIHVAPMAGTVDIITRQFCGVDVSRDTLAFWPQVPAAISSVSFTLRYEKEFLMAEISSDKLRLTSKTPSRRVYSNVMTDLEIRRHLEPKPDEKTSPRAQMSAFSIQGPESAMKAKAAEIASLGAVSQEIAEIVVEPPQLTVDVSSVADKEEKMIALSPSSFDSQRSEVQQRKSSISSIQSDDGSTGPNTFPFFVRGILQKLPIGGSVEVSLKPGTPETVSHCQHCGRHFEGSECRVTCRSCGAITCGHCLQHKVPADETGRLRPIRVCHKCYAQGRRDLEALSQRRESLESMKTPTDLASISASSLPY